MFLVMLSLSLYPVSSAVARSMVPGVFVGGVVSTVISNAVDDGDIFPAPSVAFAVMVYADACPASAMSIENCFAGAVQPVAPSAVSVAPEMVVPSLYNCTIAFASAQPTIVSPDVLFVRLSVALLPVSSSVLRSSPVGVVGAAVSLVQVAEVAVVCQLPTASLPRTQRMMEPSESEEMLSVMVVAMAVSDPYPVAVQVVPVTVLCL